MHKTARENQRTSLPVPDKLFYKIGEVSRITGVETYVWRYWETEFPFLRPRKNKSGQRVYVKKDLDQIIQIKKMLYQERYTIEGVRKRFEEGDINVTSLKNLPEEKIGKSEDPAEVIIFVKKRLREILSSIK